MMPNGGKDPAAMAAGLTDKLMDMTEVARLVDGAEMRATIQKRTAAVGNYGDSVRCHRNSP